MKKWYRKAATNILNEERDENAVIKREFILGFI